MKAIKKFDTNADKWFKSEQGQMRKIHRVYRDAMKDPAISYREADLSLLNSGLEEIVASSGQPTSEQRVNNADVSIGAAAATEIGADDGKKKGDPESYLPRDSVLRSEKGEMDERMIISRRPAKEISDIVNVGMGMPERLVEVVAQENCGKTIILTTEAGIVGEVHELSMLDSNKWYSIRFLRNYEK